MKAMMNQHITHQPDMEVAERLFATLARETSDTVGICRDSYGRGEQFAHDLLAQEAQEIGLETETDFAGNLYMTLPGANRAAPVTLIGSHIDSVPCGGNFDGMAGVIGGFSLLSALVRTGHIPQSDITVMAIRAEETPWFPYSFIGSRAALGTLPPEVVDGVRRIDTGRTLGSHMRDLGFDPDAVRAKRRHLEPARIGRFFEIHIEQGPVLIEKDIPVAIVSGILGSTRRRQARIFGEYGHSGGVPRDYRKDAVAAFIEFSHRIMNEWDAIELLGHKAVITFCTVNTDPEQASMNRIAGEVRFALDIRSLSEEVLERMDELIEDTVGHVSRSYNVIFDLGPRTTTAPSICDGGIQAQLMRSAVALGIPAIEMPSGGGHDTQAFIDAGIPAAMLFVRNANGSHNPEESMELTDLDLAVKILAHTLTEAGVL